MHVIILSVNSLCWNLEKQNGNKPLSPKQKNPPVAQNNVHFKKKFKIQK